MKILSLAITFMVVLFVAGCTEQGVYPISGDRCGPNDPVQNMSVPDCPPLI